MKFLQVDINHKDTIINIYRNHALSFPLIASVLEGKQAGKIFVNSDSNPTHVFVVNKFGFCQDFFSVFDDEFDYEIKKFIETGIVPRLRYYAPTPSIEKFLLSLEFAVKSGRTKFNYSNITKKNTEHFNILDVDKNNTKLFDFGLNLCNRYWASEDDFIKNAFAVAALIDDVPVGVCYAAGIGLLSAEIDVFVHEDYRKQGIGKTLVKGFINKCIENGIIPCWDCHSNNYGSINLALTTGFSMILNYNFYNILVKH